MVWPWTDLAPLGGGVRYAGGRAGDDDTAAGGNLSANNVTELLAFFRGRASSGSGDYDFGIKHGLSIRLDRR